LFDPIPCSSLLSLSQAEAARKLAGDSCEAVTTCDTDDNVCNTVNDNKYWSVHTMTSTDCLTRCVDGRDLAFMKSIGYKCGTCPESHCSAAFACSGGYNLFRIKDDGKCEDKCTKDKDVEKKLLDKTPWSCGQCEETMDPVETIVRSGEKINCRGWKKDDPACPSICKELPPTPDRCVLKRALQIQRYEPNWPFLEEGVHIEIKVVSTGKTYKFGDVEGAVNSIQDIGRDSKEGEYHIDDYDIFMKMKEGKDNGGIQLRYVSPRGAGGWGTCKYSPIAFDLDQSGEVELVSIPDGFYFDITGDDDDEDEKLHEWFGPKEGILVYLGKKIMNRDIEAGIAITGKELMGDQGGKYGCGYEKLYEEVSLLGIVLVDERVRMPRSHTFSHFRPPIISSSSKHSQFDKDKNGIIEGKEMKGFYLWIDVNTNFKLDVGELHEMRDYDIVGFSSKDMADGVDDDKSVAYLKKERGEEEGRTMLTHDLWFKRRR